MQDEDEGVSMEVDAQQPAINNTVAKHEREEPSLLSEGAKRRRLNEMPHIDEGSTARRDEKRRLQSRLAQRKYRMSYGPEL